MSIDLQIRVEFYSLNISTNNVLFSNEMKLDYKDQVNITFKVKFYRTNLHTIHLLFYTVFNKMKKKYINFLIHFLISMHNT